METKGMLQSWFEPQTSKSSRVLVHKRQKDLPFLEGLISSSPTLSSGPDLEGERLNLNIVKIKEQIQRKKNNSPRLRDKKYRHTLLFVFYFPLHCFVSLICLLYKHTCFIFLNYLIVKTVLEDAFTL